MNASSAPWWLSVLTSFIAALATLGAVWLTNRANERRAGAELRNTQEQFKKQLEAQRAQFVTQMAEQREVEEVKLLHERRIEVCRDVSLVLRDVAEVAAEIRKRYEKNWELMSVVAYRELHDKIDNLTMLGHRLQNVSRMALLTCGPNVCIAIDSCGTDTVHVAGQLKHHHASRTWQRLDMSKARKIVIRNHSACIGSMALELGNRWRLPPMKLENDPISESDLLTSGREDCLPVELLDEQNVAK
ncbi:hypothetical protein [Amycolatopsis sp. WGS_07]|uniref:hypothetical protein n=1 Tax=Amycolatopsis sp. WGS_07 TaxID=3076764 RepID=UPI003873AD60